MHNVGIYSRYIKKKETHVIVKEFFGFRVSLYSSSFIYSFASASIRADPGVILDFPFSRFYKAGESCTGLTHMALLSF